MVQKGQRKMRGNFRARELSSLDLQSSFFRFTYKKQDRNLRFTRRSDNEYFKIENRWKLKNWSILKSCWELKKKMVKIENYSNWKSLKIENLIKIEKSLKTEKLAKIEILVKIEKLVRIEKMKNWSKLKNWKNRQNLQNWPKLVKTKKIEKLKNLQNW